MKTCSFYLYSSKLLLITACLGLWFCRQKTEETPDRELSLRTYKAESITGIVEYAHKPEGPWVPLQKGKLLYGGQCMRTSHDATALLKGNFGDQIFMMELSRIVLDPAFLRKYAGADQRTRSLQVLSGKVWLDIAKGYGSFIASTPKGLARVKGTRFSITFDLQTGKTRVVLAEGMVSVEPLDQPEKSVDLEPGQQLELQPDGMMTSPTQAEKEELDSRNYLPGPVQPTADTVSRDTTASQTKPESADKADKLSPPPKPTDFKKVEKKLDKETQKLDSRRKTSREAVEKQLKIRREREKHERKKVETELEHQKKKEEAYRKLNQEKQKIQEREKDAFDELEKELEEY